MLNRDQPLLRLAPRWQEHPAVVLEQPVRMTVLVVDRDEVAEVAYRLRAEDDAALSTDRHDVRWEIVTLDRPIDAVDGECAQSVDTAVGLRRHGPPQHRAARRHRHRVSAGHAPAPAVPHGTPRPHL